MIDRENIGFAMLSARPRLSKTFFREERKEPSFDLRTGRYDRYTIEQRLVGIGSNAITKKINDRGAPHGVRCILIRTVKREGGGENWLDPLAKARGPDRTRPAVRL